MTLSIVILQAARPGSWDARGRQRPWRFVTQSLVLGNGHLDHGSKTLTEDAPFGQRHGGVTGPVVEGLASNERQTLGADGIEGRLALFIGLLRKRRLLIPRGQGGTACWVHARAVAAATVAALERGRAGQAYNVVDDQPVPWRTFPTTVAERYTARRLSPAQLAGWPRRTWQP